jgi:hypothetical protein
MGDHDKITVWKCYGMNNAYDYSMDSECRHIFIWKIREILSHVFEQLLKFSG